MFGKVLETSFHKVLFNLIKNFREMGTQMTFLSSGIVWYK